MALSSGIGPVVGQNWGAKKFDRARGATKWAFVFCLVYGALVGLMLLFLATPIAGLLASGQSDQEYASSYLRLVGLSMFGYGMVVVANAAMNARDKAVWSMSLSLGRIFVIYLPGAWLGVMLFGYWGILVAAVLANVLGGLSALFATTRTDLLRVRNLVPSPGRRQAQN
jgi:Na+-driven multidrug efflux pump